MSKKQMGFTLIEIVMVLVLLGILSAVAVPKYFDLQDRALKSAAQATVAEVQARLNARFAAALLAGQDCSTAVTTAFKGDTSIAEAKDDIKGTTTDSKNTAYGDWIISTLTTPASGTTSTPIGVTYNGTEYTAGPSGTTFSIAVPACADTSATKK